MNRNKTAGDCRKTRVTFAMCVLACGLSMIAISTAQADWTQIGVNAQHSGVSTGRAPTDLTVRLWNRSTDDAMQTIAFDGPSGIAAHDGRVFAVARVLTGSTHTANRVIAFDRFDGSILWQTLVDKSASESWSSPVVDDETGNVLIGVGKRVYALSAVDGAVAWSKLLDRNIVNATITLTDDLEFRRALISDYDPFGGNAKLYCLNLAPPDAIDNPYMPGEVVWARPIGSASGATAAYADGRVYVATRSAPGGMVEHGAIQCFGVHAGAPATPLWTATFNQPFFGGVAYREGHVYAATYNFNGTGDNSMLVKIRTDDGGTAWTTPCERSASIPVVGDGAIYLSAGLPGFGSIPKVQAFVDNSASAAKVWDSHADSGGSLIVGGWTCIPFLNNGRLYVGRMPVTGPGFGAYTDLFILDTTMTPSDAGFVVDQRSGAGATPGLCGGYLLSIGTDGLSCFARCGDFNGDGLVDGDDIDGFVRAAVEVSPSDVQKALGDLNGDDQIDGLDRALFVAKLMTP